MNYAKRLERVAVLGAAGKMGSGIVLLTALEMADLALDPANKGRTSPCNAVDVSSAASRGLMKYLADPGPQGRREEDRRPAQGLRRPRGPGRERGDHPPVRRRRPGRRPADDPARIGLRRDASSSRPSTRIPPSRSSSSAQIDTPRTATPWFLTNTSSIPIHELDEKAGLGGRIIGLPFLQSAGRPEARRGHQGRTRPCPSWPPSPREFAKRLRKTVVPSHDVAGFIGNGHFMRDALYGLAEVERLAPEYGVRRGRLRGQQGDPGLPHPADGHLPAGRLRRPGRLPVHPGGHERPPARGAASTARVLDAMRRQGRRWAVNSPTARRRTACSNTKRAGRRPSTIREKRPTCPSPRSPPRLRRASSARRPPASSPGRRSSATPDKADLLEAYLRRAAGR